MDYTREHRDAIVDAFSRDELEELLVFDMEIILGNVVDTAKPFPTIVFQLLRHLKREGRVKEFIDKAISVKPNYSKLAQFASREIVTPAGPQNISEADSGNNLERALKGRSPDMDFGLFSGRSQDLANKICSVICTVTNGTKYGTGWVIGPDLLITNRHILNHILDGRHEPNTVEFRFDYRTDLDGNLVNKGTSVSLAANWNLASSKHSISDTQVDSPEPTLSLIHI